MRESEREPNGATAKNPDLSRALPQRWRTAHNARAARIQRDGPGLDALMSRRESLRWWHADRTGHAAAIARWQLLLTVYSVGGFCWSDCGQLLVWIDREDLANGELTRVQGSVSSG